MELAQVSTQVCDEQTAVFLVSHDPFLAGPLGLTVPCHLPLFLQGLGDKQCLQDCCFLISFR